jgi:hypothetical protein
MRNICLFSACLLLLFGVAFGQQQPDTNSASNSQATQAKVTGCLKTSANGFTLDSDSGTTYQLAGNTAELQKLSGTQVTVTGTGGTSSADSRGSEERKGNAASNSATGTAPVIQVSNVIKVSDNCMK